jgi:hypothetical protein
MRRIWLAVGISVAAFLAPRAGSAQGKVLTVPAATQHDNVSVQGTLQYGQFLGPPGYGENPSADRKEYEYYLQLPAPIAQQNAELRLGPEFEKQNEFFVQVRGSDALKARLSRLIGRKVSVSGSIEASAIGHDRTGIVLNASRVTAIRDWSW